MAFEAACRYIALLSAGVKGFVDGTCDLFINIGPLSESQAAPLVRQAAVVLLSATHMHRQNLHMVHELALYVLSLSRSLRCLHACRDQNRTIMQIPFAVGSARLVHSWRSWGEPPGSPILNTSNAEPHCHEYSDFCAAGAVPACLIPVLTCLGYHS